MIILIMINSHNNSHNNNDNNNDNNNNDNNNNDNNNDNNLEAEAQDDGRGRRLPYATEVYTPTPIYVYSV